MNEEKADTASLSPQLQIGEIARRAAVSIRTVRYYEERGLLSPSSSTSGGIRLYTARDANRLIFIRRLKTLGLSIEEMKLCLGAIGPDSPHKARVKSTRKLLTMQREKLEKQIGELTSMRDEIEGSLEKIRKCMGCKANGCPARCPNREYVL
jgi:MerR family Zn(II)-responsive transcriptional regulator of zntA